MRNICSSLLVDCEACCDLGARKRFLVAKRCFESFDFGGFESCSQYHSLTLTFKAATPPMPHDPGRVDTLKHSKCKDEPNQIWVPVWRTE